MGTGLVVGRGAAATELEVGLTDGADLDAGAGVRATTKADDTRPARATPLRSSAPADTLRTTVAPGANGRAGRKTRTVSRSNQAMLPSRGFEPIVAANAAPVASRAIGRLKRTDSAAEAGTSAARAAGRNRTTAGATDVRTVRGSS